MSLNQIDGVTFRYRAGMKIRMGLGAVIILFLSVSFLLEELTPENLILLGMFLVFLIAIGYVFLRYSGKITIDGQGVRSTNLFGGEKDLPWGEITVQPRGGMRRELVLIDNLGGNKVRIDAELNGFEQAVELVRQRRSDLWRQPGGMYEQEPNWLNLAVLLGFLILICLFPLVGFFLSSPSGSSDFLVIGFFILILVIVLISILAKLVWRVRLDGDLLTIRKLTGEQRLQATEIDDIRLEVVRAGRSGRIPVVKVFARQGKILTTLPGQFMDTPNLYCVLRTWWEDKRTAL